MKSKCSAILLVLGLGAGCGGGGSNEEPFGGQYTVKTELLSTTCKNISLGQGNTHTASITANSSNVTIADDSGLSLSGSLSGKTLTASGTHQVQVNGFCSTSNTVSINAQLLDNSTVQGTAKIQINYPASCQKMSARTCTADLKYEATRPNPDATTPPASTIAAGTLLWSNSTRLAGGGTYPAVDVDTNGIAHALYRRDHQVYYRRYASGKWGSEVHVNDGNSNTELEIKDRNLPKVTIDDKNQAWLLWGGDLPTLYIYIRGVDANGNFITPIHQLEITDVLPNMGAGGAGPGSIAERPEEVALSFSRMDKKLHVSAVYVGDCDTCPYSSRRDGVYDMVLDPATLRIETATKLGNASKNLYSVSGPAKTHGVFRLKTIIYYRWEGGQDTTATASEPKHLGALGAVNIWSSDDNLVHTTTISTYPVLDKHDSKAFTDRDLSYAKFNATNPQSLLEVVPIEVGFHSPYGIPPVLVTAAGHVFIAYDRSVAELSGFPITASNTIQEVGFAWRKGTTAGKFTGPSQAFIWPGRTISLGGEPAIAMSGSTIHVVWDGTKETNSFDAATATFQP